MHAQTIKGNSERPINPKLNYFWTLGESWSTCSEPTHEEGEPANSMQKAPQVGNRPHDPFSYM